MGTPEDMAADKYFTPPEDAEKQEKLQPRITVDYGRGRWGRVFHLFDSDKREIVLGETEAVSLAKKILKVAKEK